MKSYHIRIPKYEMPLRLRPVSLLTALRTFYTVLNRACAVVHPVHFHCYDTSWFVLRSIPGALAYSRSALLGFTDYSHGVPVNDKVQHAVAFFTATLLFYFVFDVDESGNWILMLPSVICPDCFAFL
jgi:hypothetical protein